MDINIDSGNYCVYMHTSPNGKKYIGVTSQNPPTKRWQRNGIGYIKNQHFYRAIIKYGWEYFKHEVLIDNISKEKAFQIEISLIKRFDSDNYKFGYNKCSGGEGCTGLFGEKSPNYAKKRSQETIEKIKKAKKAKPTIYTEEHLQKLRDFMLLRWQDDEYRQSKSGKNAPAYGRVGEKHPLYGKRGKDSKVSKAVICLTTNKMFFSAREASDFYGANHSKLCMCCRGERSSCGKLEDGKKLKWMFYNDYVKLVNNEMMR